MADLHARIDEVVGAADSALQTLYRTVDSLEYQEEDDANEAPTGGSFSAKLARLGVLVDRIAGVANGLENLIGQNGLKQAPPVAQSGSLHKSPKKGR